MARVILHKSNRTLRIEALEKEITKLENSFFSGNKKGYQLEALAKLVETNKDEIKKLKELNPFKKR